MDLLDNPEFCKILTFLTENNFDQSFNLKFSEENTTFQVEAKTEYQHFVDGNNNPVLINISIPYDDGVILYLFPSITSNFLQNNLRKSVRDKNGNLHPVIYFHIDDHERTTKQIECSAEWVIPILQTFMARVDERFNKSQNQNLPALISTLLFIDYDNSNSSSTIGPALLKFIAIEKERMFNNLTLATTLIPFLSVDLAVILAMTHEEFQSFNNIEDLPIEVLFSLFG
jgi:hypothetical protein